MVPRAELRAPGWERVTARESDALVLCSAVALQGNPAKASITWIRVGEAPDGLILVNQGHRLLVANSNRFGVQGQTAGIGMVNVAAVKGRQARRARHGQVRLVPREFAPEAKGRTLLPDNYQSR